MIVSPSGNRLRIVAQLSDGESGAQLWAESYDRELADMFAVQEQVARKIVDELKITLSPQETAQWPRIASTGTSSVEAYDFFLRRRAMQRGATQNLDVFERTVEMFRKATDHDDAGRLVDEAIARDPNDAFTHGVAALVSMYRKDFARWSSEVEISLALNRNFAPALALRGILNTYSGKPWAAVEDLEQAIRLDPLFTQTCVHHLAVAHLVAG